MAPRVKKKKKFWFEEFADVCGVSAPITANYKVPNWLEVKSVQGTWEEPDGHDWPSSNTGRSGTALTGAFKNTVTFLW